MRCPLYLAVSILLSIHWSICFSCHSHASSFPHTLAFYVRLSNNLSIYPAVCLVVQPLLSHFGLLCPSIYASIRLSCIHPVLFVWQYNLHSLTLWLGLFTHVTMSPIRCLSVHLLFSKFGILCTSIDPLSVRLKSFNQLVCCPRVGGGGHEWIELRWVLELERWPIMASVRVEHSGHEWIYLS